MRLSISSTNVNEWSGDVLAVGLPKGDPSSTAGHLESRFAGVSSALSQQAFEGKTGQKLVPVSYTHLTLPTNREV